MAIHLQTLTFLLVALVGSHVTIDRFVGAIADPERECPPGADSLPASAYVVGKPKENFPRHDDAATDEQIMSLKTSSLFFMENDMHLGKKFFLHISRDTTVTPSFISRKVADSFPFTSNKLQNIYESIKINPNSVEAKLIKQTVQECEEASNKGHDEYCATSSESMVEFATSKMGQKVKAISTQVDGIESTMLQGYKIKVVKKLPVDSVVVCHQQYYAYKVHYCHKSSNINVYEVSLIGENNVRAKAISVCHEDTTSWNPKHLAFQVLNVKPGKASVCHFLVENDVAWVPSRM